MTRIVLICQKKKKQRIVVNLADEKQLINDVPPLFISSAICCIWICQRFSKGNEYSCMYNDDKT